MKKIKKEFIIPIVVTVLSGIALSIWQLEIDKMIIKPKQDSNENNTQSVNNQTTVRDIRKIDTVFIEKPIYVQTSTSMEISERPLDMSEKVSALISAFDHSSIDNINTQIRRTVYDTLSDGSVNRRRIPLLLSKTTEQTFIEMKSVNAELIALLNASGLTEEYATVIDSQKNQLHLASQKFSGDMNSPLCGIE